MFRHENDKGLRFELCFTLIFQHNISMHDSPGRPYKYKSA